MANRYNDQDYPRYRERDDRYDSRSEYDDSERHDRDFRERDRGRGSDRGENYYGMSSNRDFGSDFGRGYSSPTRDYDDNQWNARSSRPSTGGFERNAGNDRSDYTLYGYDRENQYSSGSDEERGYYNRGGDYGYGSNFGSSGANFDRMDASDYTRRSGLRGDYGRGSGRDRSSQSWRNETQGSGYTGDYISSERGWETENRGGSNRDERGWWDRTTDEISSWFGDDEAARRRERDMRPGGGRTSHRGKGPKNYRRSDERIRDDINDRLTDYPYLDASDIEVEINNGEVVLTGTVESRYAKRMAEDITEDVSGVKNVENRLRVKQNTTNFGSTGTSNFSTGETNTGSTNTSTGGTTGITGTSAGTSTGSMTDTSSGVSTGNNAAATGSESTTGSTSTGNAGGTNTPPVTGRSRSKSA